MKKLLTAALLATTLTLSACSAASEPPLSHKKAHLCWVEGRIAEGYMSLRTLGESESETLSRASDPVLRDLVRFVYTAPFTTSEDGRRDLGTKVFLNCLKRVKL